MKLANLPVSLGHARCLKCGLPTALKIFESGPGGDFQTYVGGKTGALYRLDLDKVQYLAREIPALLAPAQAREGDSTNLLSVPDQLACSSCGTVLGARPVLIEGEEIVEAYEL